MEFTIEKSEFARGLRLAHGIADKKSTMPILANVLLKSVSENRVAIAATNLNVSIVLEVNAKVAKEGSITVGAKPLYDIVSSLPGDEVSFSELENNFTKIKAKRSEYKVVGLPGRDFPKVADWNGATYGKVDPKVLAEMISKVSPAIADDTSRPNLNGALFTCDGKKGEMATTDGHRLAHVERTMMGSPKIESLVIPKKGLAEIQHVLVDASEPVDLGGNKDWIFVKDGSVILSVRPLQNEFPPYKDVIPKSNPRTATVVRQTLIEALKRTQLMTPRSAGVRFTFDNDILGLAADNPELGEARDEIESEYNAAPLTISFNGKYVLEFLLEMKEDKVVFELDSELSPGIIKPVGGDPYTCVVMPMRI